MKKAIVILLTLAMALSFVACAAKDDAPAESTKPAESTAPAESTKPAPEVSAPVETDVKEQLSSEGQYAGYWDDDVDWYARDPYTFCYAMPAQTIMHEGFIQIFEKYQEKFNYKFVTSNANNDTDQYIQNLYVMAQTGVDGFFIDCDENINLRAVEVLDEIGIPYLSFVSKLVDTDGKAIAPMTLLRGYDCGFKQFDWFFENYKKYWGDIDTSKIVGVEMTFTNTRDFYERSHGATMKFEEAFPGNEVILLDMVNQQIASDAGYNMLNPVITTRPDVEYWYIWTCIEWYGQGAARLIEALDMEDRAIVTSVGIDTAQVDWANGYDGPWASLGIANYDTVCPAIMGMLALCDGRATMDTLWKERAVEDDTYGTDFGIWYTETKMVDSGTYKQYLDDMRVKYEGE